MQLTLHWNMFASMADEYIDEYVAQVLETAQDNELNVGNMLVVDSFRVQRKLGKLTTLNLEHNGSYYRVDADGRWQDMPPSSLFLMDKYLMQLL